MTNRIELTQDFYTLLLTDFPRAVATYVTSDTVWENPLPDTIPFGGVYKGPEELGAYLAALTDAIHMNPLHFTDMICEGSTVVCIGTEENTLVKRTGKRYSMPCAHVVRFDAHDKIIHVREYNDITQMLLAFEP